MRSTLAGAFAFMVATVGCAFPVRPVARAGRFAPTVMYPNGVPTDGVGEYEHTKVIRPDGSPAPFADVIELIVPGQDGDPLAAASADSADTRFLDTWHQRPAGTVVERRQADDRGSVSLAFEVGLRACPYAFCEGLAGAGDARAASLIDRPENVYGAELRLVPAITIVGDVIDEGGHPAGGATVRAAFRAPLHSGPLVLMTACDEEGAFALPPIATGDAEDPVSLRVDTDDGRSARVDLTPAELRTGPIRLTLSNRRTR